MSKDGKEPDLENSEMYQYPDEESARIEATEPAPQPASGSSRLNSKRAKGENRFLRLIFKNKRLSFIVAGVIVILVVFSWMKSGDKKKLKKIQPAPQAVVSTSTPKPDRSASDQMENRQQLNDVTQTIQSAQDSITGLQNQMQALQAQLGQLLERDKQMTKAMAYLMETAHSKNEMPVKPVPFRVLFYVRSIVPGRAWIADQWGILRSVSIGNDVPGYGRVTAIDATRGEVATDSGEVIRYGFNDH